MEYKTKAQELSFLSRKYAVNKQKSNWLELFSDDAIAKAEKMGFKDIQSIAEPDILFDDEYRISLGGLDLELYSVPGGETLDALLIYLPHHKILFSGNAFGPLFPHIPNFCTIRGDRIRFAIPYLDMCKKVLELNPEVLITGHFKPIEGQKLISKEVKNLHDAVEYIHTKTVEGINCGKDMFKLMQEIVLPKASRTLFRPCSIGIEKC